MRSRARTVFWVENGPDLLFCVFSARGFDTVLWLFFAARSIAFGDRVADCKRIGSAQSIPESGIAGRNAVATSDLFRSLHASGKFDGSTLVQGLPGREHRGDGDLLAFDLARRYFSLTLSRVYFFLWLSLLMSNAQTWNDILRTMVEVRDAHGWQA